MTMTRLSTTTLFIALALAGCGEKGAEQEAANSDLAQLASVAGGGISATPAANVSGERLLAAEAEPEQWMTYGGSYDETRHSTLSKINRDTLQDLGIGWVYDMKKPRGVEATPIVVDGVMYVSGSWSVVYALDAQTGEEGDVLNLDVAGDLQCHGWRPDDAQWLGQRL